MKYRKITEVLDDNDNLIGRDDMPNSSPNRETDASHTTDYNVKIRGQNFKNDFLGRFGFYFYEGDNKEEIQNPEFLNDVAKLMFEKYKDVLKYYYENMDKLESDYKNFIKSGKSFEDFEKEDVKTDYEWAEKFINVLKPRLEAGIDEMISESKVVEDKLTTKSNKDIVDKKEDNELKNKKMKKVADLLSKLPDNKIDQLINLLEKNKK